MGRRVQQEKPYAERLLFDTLAEMRIELVLTAHPTETIRTQPVLSMPWTFLSLYDGRTIRVSQLL